MPAPQSEPLYRRIADRITQQVARGSLRPGDRVPSLRRLSRQQRVSLSTAMQAYVWLETRGFLEARPQSGFYVRTPFNALIPEPSFDAGSTSPVVMGRRAIIDEIIATLSDSAQIPLGAGGASAELYPNRRLNILMRRIIGREPLHSMRYDFPPGWEPLRRQIARRSIEHGCELAPTAVTITNGAMDAITLGLRAATRPGDVVAVETPTYFSTIESLASLGLKVIEIPTHPQQGMDLALLDRAIRRHHITACVVMTNCHNPLGYVLSDDYKKALVELTTRHEVALIEDDVYGDLAFQSERPRTAKSFDRKGLVLLCASYSKILSPGYRLGWIAAGRYRADVERLKFLSTVSTASLPQMVVGEFLQSGGYDRHLRRLRASLALQVDRVRQAVAKYFPDGTRVSRPAGGYMLWVELPAEVSAVKLYRAARDQNISIVPGPIFSTGARFQHHIRLNCGHAWSDAYDRAVLTLGRLCSQLA